MYPYHNRIHQRIAAGELVRIDTNARHPRIGECWMLHFSTLPGTRPIRPHRYDEYRKYLEVNES